MLWPLLLAWPCLPCCCCKYTLRTAPARRRRRRQLAPLCPASKSGKTHYDRQAPAPGCNPAWHKTHYNGHFSAQLRTMRCGGESRGGRGDSSLELGRLGALSRLSSCSWVTFSAAYPRHGSIAECSTNTIGAAPIGRLGDGLARWAARLWLWRSIPPCAIMLAAATSSCARGNDDAW